MLVGDTKDEKKTNNLPVDMFCTILPNCTTPIFYLFIYVCIQ